MTFINWFKNIHFCRNYFKAFNILDMNTDKFGNCFVELGKCGRCGKNMAKINFSKGNYFVKYDWAIHHANANK